jgi:hypothetical protein
VLGRRHLATAHGGDEGDERVHEEDVEHRGNAAKVDNRTEGEACAGYGDIPEVLDHVVPEIAVAVVGLVPEVKDQPQGVDVDARVHVLRSVPLEMGGEGVLVRAVEGCRRL